MNHDFRITVGFSTHPKRLLLQSRLGKVAVLALIDLWEHCATQQWNGMLMKYTPKIIARVADWDGDPQEFVDTLCEIGFLDPVEDGYLVHDWLDHNEYCSKVLDRIESARTAGKASGAARTQRPVERPVPFPLGTPDPTRPDPKTKAIKEGIPFLTFWKSWPKKVDRCNAEKLWNTLPENDRQAAVQNVTRRHWPEDKQYIMGPAKYLRGQRWEDEESSNQKEASIYVPA